MDNNKIASDFVSSDATDVDVPVGDLDRDAADVTARLKQAIGQAGGATAVARRAGIPISTLNTYLNGRDMRRQSLVALAEACGVSLEWLATGKEFKLPGEPAKVHITTDDGQSVTKELHRRTPQLGLFEQVDPIALAAAIDYVEDSLSRSGQNLPTIERARAILLAYDLMQRDKTGKSA